MRKFGNFREFGIGGMGGIIFALSNLKTMSKTEKITSITFNRTSNIFINAGIVGLARFIKKYKITHPKKFPSLEVSPLSENVLFKIAMYIYVLKKRKCCRFDLTKKIYNQHILNMLSEDTIKKEILPYLSESGYGKKREIEKLEIVLAILHRLKTGCQWRMLPVSQYVTRKGTTWNSIYYHFNKWCKDGSWQKVWEHLLKKYKMYLDLSCINLDGSHTKAFRGGEEVGYQSRKKCKTTNMLFMIDNQGVILFCSPPIAGNHNDLYNIGDYFDNMIKMAEAADIDLRYLFLNGDAGFDSESFRLKIEGCDIEGNIDFNKRNSKN